MRRVLPALLLSIALLLAGCAGDPLTESLYTTNLYNSASMETGGITYTGDYWEELVTPANAMGEGWPAPGASNVQSGYAYSFPDVALAVDEAFLHFTFQMPHSWKEGTEVTPEVRFIFNADQVGTVVRWKIAYSWANTGENLPVSSNLWKLSDPANNDSLINQITKFDPISGAGKKIGSSLLCYISRNASDVTDNYTQTVRLLSVGLLYQVDTPGSINQWTK